MATSATPDAASSAVSNPYAPPAEPPFDPATVNVHAPSYCANPYPTYAAFRRAAPIAPVAPYGSRWVFRHADVVAALADTATYVKNPPGGATPAPGIFGVLSTMPPGVFSSDPPRHTALRGTFEPLLVAAFANAGAVAGGIAGGILDGVRQRGTRRLELMADYAIAVPSGTLFTLLGIPQAHWPALVGMVGAIAMSNDPTQSMGVQVAGGTSAMALYFYCQAIVRELAASPNDTTIGRMHAAALAAGLTAEDVQTTLVNLLVAGYLSTTFLIGSGILSLLAHPEQLALLRAQPDLIAAAVAEMLRHDAPAQVVDRVVAADTTLGGTALRAGDRVTLVLGSANRDEAVFADPDRFDVQRTDGAAAIPFGGGIHACIGAPLVRIVGPTAIGRLVAGLPNMRLAGLVQWQTDPYLRAPTNVPLAI